MVKHDEMLHFCKCLVNGNNYLCDLDLPIPPPSSLSFSISLSLSPLPRLLIFLPRCPYTPQVLASLRTVRSNFTILANVTTPTNKSVSYRQTPLPPTSTCHDSLLSLCCLLFANVSRSLPWERLLPSRLTSLWLFDDAQGNLISALFDILPAPSVPGSVARQ